MKKTSLYLLAGTLLCAATSPLVAQTVSYQEFTAPVYRFAEDQRFSDHKKVFYLADLDKPLLESLLSSSANKEAAVDQFRVSIMQELSRTGIRSTADGGDLTVAYLVDKMNLSPVNNAGFGVTYSVEGIIREVVMNRKGEPYANKTHKISKQETLSTADQISNEFTKMLTNGKAVDVYRVAFKNIRRLAAETEKTYVNGYQTQTFSLPFIYRAKKKYPEFMVLDSLNESLVNTLKKKETTDYSNIIKPYEQQYLQIAGQQYPADYNLKQIKVAAYSQLSFLYYLAYDTVNLKNALDTLYANSSKFLGTRADYELRGSLAKELRGYYATVNERKYPLDSSSGEIRSDMFSTEKLSDGWILLNQGDTIKGRYIDEHFKGTMIDLDAGKYVKFEIIEKEKARRKNYKLADVNSFGFLGKTYEIHKFKPVFEQNNAVGLDMLRSKNYPLQVIYSSPKIRILKENFGEGATNAIVFIRPAEEEVANQGRDWFKKKEEMMKEYFKDCPEMIAKIGNYDFKTEAGYIKMAEDYTNSCK
ncbi:hypothetical protein [Chitinophaga rhizophila]|uniref:Uncharacterized protein n=1 Tax=Chitinophaga rhizophila TaxID=2866212 RepID=A0ABS7GAC0_9BACT|nr:hypothetical protein [Chitinophaga rhizophila]MBW8684594.1 hypothetical protein [Chitinophaga rhizophila]